MDYWIRFDEERRRTAFGEVSAIVLTRVDQGRGAR